MKKQNINQILKEVLSRVNPPEEDIIDIEKFLKILVLRIEKNLKSRKINAEVFIGGSFSKKTLIKKGLYDIDVFIRFSEENKGKNISKFAEKAVSGIKMGKISLIHGSRDYFKIEPDNRNFFVEIIPVMKIKNPKKAENITDLSYFHVSYIKRKLKTG